MIKRVGLGLFVAALVMTVTPLGVSATPRPNRHPGGDRDHQFDPSRHVLLISIDGMHALDYENCVASKTCPNLAALGKTGVNYTRTSTSRPSDSFPGLMALVTGGNAENRRCVLRCRL